MKTENGNFINDNTPTCWDILYFIILGENYNHWNRFTGADLEVGKENPLRFKYHVAYTVSLTWVLQVFLEKIYIDVLLFHPNMLLSYNSCSFIEVCDFWT